MKREPNDNALALAAFQALPGPGFAGYGTKPATDTALLDLRTQHGDDPSFGFRGDARIGTGTARGLTASSACPSSFPERILTFGPVQKSQSDHFSG
jgi:hypothetical protein